MTRWKRDIPRSRPRPPGHGRRDNDGPNNFLYRLFPICLLLRHSSDPGDRDRLGKCDGFADIQASLSDITGMLHITGLRRASDSDSTEY